MMPPPPTRREDVVDTLHGVDRRRPLPLVGGRRRPRGAQWVAAQNRHTRQALDARPDRECVARAPRRVDGPARRAGGAWSAATALFTRRAARRRRAVRAGAALARRSIPRRRAGRPGRPRRSVPPTRPAPSTGSTPSPDGTLVALGISEGGTEHSTLRVLVVGTGRAARPARRRDPRHPGVQRGVGARRLGLLLHPLPGGRRVPPHGVTTTDSATTVARRPGRVGRAPRRRRRGPTVDAVARRSLACWSHVMVGWSRHRRPRARPVAPDAG